MRLQAPFAHAGPCRHSNAFRNGRFGQGFTTYAYTGTRMSAPGRPKRELVPKHRVRRVAQ
jgi:hypothetical protein